MSTSNESVEESSKWLHPNQLLKLQRFKVKKRQLQARINNSELNVSDDGFNVNVNNISICGKRPNPFVKPFRDCKRTKLNANESSSDGTLFGLLHSNGAIKRPHTLISFNKTISVPNDSSLNKADNVPPIKAQLSWVPIDWTLNCKLRLLSSNPFSWSHKLKISEEASGITAFVRCLNYNSETTLDTSPNAKFHQCCLFWQQPHFPWLSLFPRTQAQSSSGPSFVTTTAMRDSLHMAWSDGLRSLFQLLRTRQCPFFYVCTNTFTVLFRAAGICGHAEMVALISPTTYGFRQLLRQEEIEFSMPLKAKSGTKDKGDGSDDEGSEEKWLASMGINEEDRKQISYTEKQRHRKTECEVDNSEGSLVLIQGMEVHGLYNFLINCKSATSITGSLAGIPPTLLSPIAFQGATLSTLKVKETKILVDNVSYFSLELNGPILPHIIHNLSELNPQDQSFTATFGHITSSMAFSKLSETEKIETDNNTSGFSVFSKENLSDCGLTSPILKHFCSSEKGLIQNVDSLKYNPEMKSYTWL